MIATEYGYSGASGITTHVPLAFEGWGTTGYSAKVHFFLAQRGNALCGIARDHDSSRFIAYDGLTDDMHLPARCPRCKDKLARRQRKAGA